MKTFTLAVVLAALAAMAQAGKIGIGACGAQGGCPGVCRMKYGPQADGTCQDNEDFQRCVCLHTNRPVKTGECEALGSCKWFCVSKYGYQADGFCQKSEDEERCICINVEAAPFFRGAKEAPKTKGPVPKGRLERFQPKVTKQNTVRNVYGI